MSSFAACAPMGQKCFLLALERCAVYWLVMSTERQLLALRAAGLASMHELTTLVLRQGIADVLRAPVRHTLEQDILPAYLPMRRWYAAKNEKLQQTRIAVAVELGNTTQPMLLAEIETLMSLDTARYVLPFGFVAEGEAAS